MMMAGEVVQPEVPGVVLSETGATLAGATVFIRKLKKYDMTDAEGGFELKNIPDGEYEVDISFVGYHAFATRITATNHPGGGVGEIEAVHEPIG
jgi:CarboxypepD_reg-like domain